MCDVMRFYQHLASTQTMRWEPELKREMANVLPRSSSKEAMRLDAPQLTAQHSGDCCWQ